MMVIAILCHLNKKKTLPDFCKTSHYVVLLIIRHQRQHGRHRDTEKVLKKMKITINPLTLTTAVLWKDGWFWLLTLNVN